MTPTGYTEDALVEQLAIALLGKLGWGTVKAYHGAYWRLFCCAPKQPVGFIDELVKKLRITNYELG